MAKITQVTIVNASTIRLDVDAKQGDEIDLLDISKIDTSIIKNMLVEAEDKEIKKEYELKQQEAIRMALLESQNKHNEQITLLKDNLVKLQEQINSYDTQKASEKEALKSKLELEKEQAIALLNNKIVDLNNQINNLTLKKDLELNTKLNEQKEIYEERLKEKEGKINELTLNKSSLNIKKLGEQLENWCNMEYENYAQSGFDNCVWEKDNTAVKEDGDSKGTKADYIFRVYESAALKTELTSVACEMKNESPTSVNKKKNADHFAKLDKDRNKKNCEYALLISELEWDQTNDIPIRKVKEYDKMYIVRPQYFINFLSVINSLASKFKDLLLSEQEEVEKFKDVTKIKEDFEALKKDLFDKPLSRLENKLKEIISNAETIQKSSTKILEAANTLVNDTLTGMKNKIENYNITNKICKKINKLEDNE